jgi:hypothetical protein
MRKRLLPVLSLLFILTSCENNPSQKPEITGTWKMIYNEVKEKDAVQIKDLSKTDFIKIINNSHFSFINQPKDSTGSFYAGAGTYSFDGENYIETLSYIEYKPIRNHQFRFKVKIKGDTLIQFGREKIEAANMDREIVEKYIRIK